MQKGDNNMHQFDYSFLDNGMIPAGLFNIATDIYSMVIEAPSIAP